MYLQFWIQFQWEGRCLESIKSTIGFKLLIYIGSETALSVSEFAFACEYQFISDCLLDREKWTFIGTIVAKLMKLNDSDFSEIFCNEPSCLK